MLFRGWQEFLPFACHPRGIFEGPRKATMSKKQLAALVAAALSAIAGVLTQCPDDPPARTGTTDVADAGASSVTGDDPNG